MAYASEKTGGSCFEEIALATFGPKVQKFTSFCMIATNIGFVITYIVLFKSFAPYSFGRLGIDLPEWCADTFKGQIFWACIFTVIISLVSLPRKLSAIRFGSALGVCISVYVVLAIVFLAFLDRGASPTLSEGFEAGRENK